LSRRRFSFCIFAATADVIILSPRGELHLKLQLLARVLGILDFKTCKKFLNSFLKWEEGLEKFGL